MSDSLVHFRCGSSTSAVALPFALRERVAEWQGIRRALVSSVPDAFSRDEWAYVVAAIDREQLLAWFETAFGDLAGTPADRVRHLYRPRGDIAVWLPNNVSLLGPILVIALSLVGVPVRFKLGSAGADLVRPFVDHLLGLLPKGPLRAWLAEQVETLRIARDDTDQAALTERTQVRIVFGSDAAARAVDAMPRPLRSIGFPFVDRRSEAWIEPAAVSDDLLVTLARVFAIYGQAGCTSPGRVLLIGGTLAGAVALRDRLLELWPTAVRAPVPMHQASENYMAAQWARALGWDAEPAPGNAAALAVGSPDLPDVGGPFTLKFMSTSIHEAIDGLPDNIQTVGHALAGPVDASWLERIARSRVARFVPIARMHHFSGTWDGHEFWRQCFEAVEIIDG